MKKLIVVPLFILAFLSMSVFVYTANQQKSDPASTIKGLFALIQKDIVGDEKMKEGVRKDESLFQEYRHSNAKFHKKVSSFIDFEKLGTISMPEKWQHKFWVIKPSEKKIMIDLLQSLIEEIVYPRAKDFLDKHTLNHKETKFEGNETVVRIYYTVEYKKESGEIEHLPLMFRLHKKRSSWKIYDILLEDQLWTDMFKNQFNHIITTQSYDVLIEKMREKLKRVQTGVSF